MKSNLPNQLYIHKIRSSDGSKSPTCFGTSQVPSSGSPLSSLHNTHSQTLAHTLTHIMCMQVFGCVFTHLPCNGPFWGCCDGYWEDCLTCDVPKHLGDLLTSDEHMLCMWSWLCKLKSVNVHLNILLCYPCKESGVIVHMIQILIRCEKFVIFDCFNCIGIDAMLLQLAYIYIYIHQQNWKVITPPFSQKLSLRWHIVNFF
jgi:hypothetical protein